MPRVTTGPLNAFDGIRHAFFTRIGGVSEGLYASNNCGFGSADHPDNVASNRARSAARLDASAADLVTVHQIHSADAVRVDAPWLRESAPRADGMATATPGIVLGILTADCAPILLADPEARVIGAAHAGWRGALGGVLEATVRAMTGLGAAPSRIVAGIGPCIAQRSYEVGPEFPASFLADDPRNEMFFQPAAAAGKWLFDLKRYVASRLDGIGVQRITMMPNDTCAEEDRFFSYRRACQRGDRDYGRLLSAITLET
jgi:YfiH family protein